MTSPRTMTPSQVTLLSAVRLQLYQLKQHHHLFLRNLPLGDPSWETLSQQSHLQKRRRRRQSWKKKEANKKILQNLYWGKSKYLRRWIIRRGCKECKSYKRPKMPGYEEMHSPRAVLSNVEQPASWKWKSSPCVVLLLEGEVWETIPTDIPLCGLDCEKRIYFKASYCNYRKLSSNTSTAFGNLLFSHALLITALVKVYIIVGILIRSVTNLYFSCFRCSCDL